MVRAKEEKLVIEKRDDNEVKKLEKNIKNDSLQKLYDRLAHSDKNTAESCINILYNKGGLQFDNSNLWKVLENLSSNRVLFRNSQELNSREILQKVKKAVELIWSKEYLRKWGIVGSNGEIIKMENQNHSLAA